MTDGNLVIREGEGAGSEFPLDGELVLGRERGSADLVIDDPGISRRHAAVRALGGAITVEDLGSSNGTYVNGERISEEVELADGDEIQVGGAVLSVQGGDAPTAATAVVGADTPRTQVQPRRPAPAQPPQPPPPPRRPQQPPPSRAQPPPARGRLAPRPDEGSNIHALVAVFLGPLALLLLFTSGAGFFVALPCAIAAIVFGTMGIRRVDRGEADSHRTLARIGRLTGILAAVLSTLALVAFVVVAAALDASEDSLEGIVDRVQEEIDGVDIPDVPDAPDIDTPDVPDVPDGGDQDSGGVEAP
jgi:hypothetical protein